VTEGDLTPAAGYNLMLLIDASAVHGLEWGGDTWVRILPGDITAVRSLEVEDLHAWLRQEPACLGPDRQLSREAVVGWVRQNQAEVEAWLAEHSQHCALEFEDTIPN
jgi:hypothetical protein